MGRVQSTALWSCMFCIASCLALGAQTSPSLSSTLIADAIELGTYGEPAPYLLRHAGGRTPNSVIVGAIYTPYVRVALAARAARAAGRTFAEADVTPQLIEPVFYVAYRWYCCDVEQNRDTFNPFASFDYKLARVPSPATPSNLHQASPPLWIRRGVSTLASFGGKLPYNDVVLVAAYPLNLLTTDHDLVIYRDHVTDGRVTARNIRAGRILASELATWR